MKKYILLSLLTLMVLSACEKDEFGPVLFISDKPVITSPAGGTSIVMTEESAATAFPTVTWSEANFGFKAGTSYTVEIDAAGSNFANPITLGTVFGTSLSGLTYGKVNAQLLSNEYVGEAAAQMEMRVAAKVSDDVEIVYSDPIAIAITPYTVVIDYPILHVPGNYQGWKPEDETTVIYSIKSDDKYEGYVYFSDPATMYKYTETPSWEVNWGDDGGDGTLEPSGADIAATQGIGLYRLNVDLKARTHTAVKTDWGVIGDATPGGWDTDTDMVYDETSGTLKVTMDLTGGGFIKFRANNDWVIDFGDDDANGDLQYGGENIAISESGNYTIELILNQARYLYKLTKN